MFYKSASFYTGDCCRDQSKVLCLVGSERIEFDFVGIMLTAASEWDQVVLTVLLCAIFPGKLNLAGFPSVNWVLKVTS